MHFNKFLMGFLVISIISGFIGITSDSHSSGLDCTKTYLEASKAMRAGDFKTAVDLLEKILDECDDPDLLLKADEKLSEALEGLKQASLPKVPGIYIQNLAGDLVQLNKEPVASANLMRKGATSISDALNAPRVDFILSLSSISVPVDQIESIIIYSPDVQTVAKCNVNMLHAIQPEERKWVELPRNAQGKTKYVLYSEWSDITASEEEFGSDQIIKEKLGQGMFKIAFPKKYIPNGARALAVTDGSGYACPFIIQPSTAVLIYNQYVLKGDTSPEAVNAMEEAIRLKPDDPILTDALAYTYYQNKDYDRALELANKSIKLGEEQQHAQLDVFKSRIAFIEAGKMINDVQENYMTDSAKQVEGLEILKEALEKDPTSAEGYYTASKIYFDQKDHSNSCDMATKAYEQAKNQKLKDKDKYEDNYHQIHCDVILDEIEKTCMEEGADVEACIEKGKNALKHRKNSCKANYTLALLYDRAGKDKDSQKYAKKAASEAKKKDPKIAAYYYHQLASLYSKSEKYKDAIKAEQEAIEIAEKSGLDTAEYQQALTRYEELKNSK